jgi:hypothetical protein
MQQSANNLLDFIIIGSDGYLGPLRDIYFDDGEWTFRYLVIEIAEPDTTSRYLISPLSIKQISFERKEIYIRLDQEKIINSPEIDVNLPISRQNEIALRRYYEWPVYWGETEFLDTPPHSGLEKPLIPFDTERFADEPPEFLSDENDELTGIEPIDDELLETDFAHSEEDVTYNSELRSYIELLGYRIQCTDSDSSFIADLIYDDIDWIIKYIVLNLGNSLTNELILMTLHWVNGINWSKSRMLVTLDQQQLNSAPRYTKNQKITKEYEKNIFDYYDAI